MLPVGKQKQVPKSTPPSLCPRGLNMQRVLLDPPPHPISDCTHVGSRVSVDTKNPRHTPLVTAELLHLPTQSGSSISRLPPPHSIPPLLQSLSGAR